MKKFLLSMAISGLMISPMLSSTSMAEVYQSLDKSYNLKSTPLDVAASIDSQHTFVLTEGGKVYIYSQSGELDMIQVDSSMDRIFTSGRGDKIHVSSSKTKKMQEIFIDFKQDIDTSGSPFLGNENAPVTIVAFSDFQ